MKATFMKGVALGSAVSLATLAATAAFAGTGIGKVFNIGEDNRVNARSQLEGSTPSAVLKVTNTNSSAAASGIAIDVPGSSPPLVVNSATKVKNFNADLLDGKEASKFQSATSRSCSNGTAITSIAPNGTTACASPVVLPIDSTLAPGASNPLSALFAPSSLSLSFSCETGDVGTAEMEIRDNGAAPATVNYLDQINKLVPNVGNQILTSAPTSEITFTGQPHNMYQIEYLDDTTVTTINVSLLVVTVGTTFESCEVQGTVVVARR
jgi:hypothetical protein